MNFTYEELALLNQLISMAIINGEVSDEKAMKSVHEKVTAEIARQNDCLFKTEPESEE